MWVLLKGGDGKRLLLNLDQVFCFQEGPKGEALAVSLQGATAPTGETFDTVQNDLMAEEEEP